MRDLLALSGRAATEMGTTDKKIVRYVTKHSKDATRELSRWLDLARIKAKGG